MSTELKNLRKQRLQAVKNTNYHLISSRFSISEELAYYDSLQNLEEIESHITETKLSTKRYGKDNKITKRNF